ncbi:AbrB family transcriptional regulator [Pseudooceanicola nanhaiensis]|uniref:AbrB family transcriptional regulator n=1 Tax=Pseudooceanicola nanhaiensis TaxID=375761 RepID=UPI001CD19744|nr:AbrB family transcriptional regulator [Pseudooceanicola nanhaiensis]MCA0921642.1 AbrB family transcriptional regulator [Pseudooceanicola nanhaiensis]
MTITSETVSPAVPAQWLRGPMRLGVMWLALFGLSALLAWALEMVHLPAALLLGPMVAAITLASSGLTSANHVLPRSMGLPRVIFALAQSVVGTMIATTIPVETLGGVLQDLPVFLFGVISVIAASAWLGYALTKRQVLPGATAVWGSTPGAAQAMVFLAEANGADMRLVAVMQYLRVGMVAAGASLIARFWLGAPEVAAEPINWFPAPDFALVQALGLMAIGMVLGRVFKLPAGEFLGPLLIGTALQGFGLISPEVPHWMLALAFAVVGWTIGLRFTKAILLHAWKALPRLVFSILMLMALCAGFAVLISVTMDVDLLTAYLATSPGGADSVAVIAASSDVDIAFVMAMQTLRFILVLISGPMIAKFVAKKVGALAQG